MKLSPENVSTKRTAINSGVTVFLIGMISWITGKEITLDSESMIYVAAIFGVVSGIFYRASRVAADKVPWLGYILFGSVMKPVAYVSTKPEGEPPPVVEPGEGVVVDPAPRDVGKVATLDALGFSLLAILLIAVAAAL